MSVGIEKIGAELVVENASGFISAMNKAKSATVEFGKSTKRSLENLGKGSLAVEKYNATMKSLDAQMNVSKSKIADLKKQYDELKKSNEQLPSTIDKVTKKFNEKKKALDDTKQAMDQQQKVVDKLAKTQKRGSEELTNARAKLKELKQEYSSGRKEVNSLEQEVKTLNNTFEKQEKQLADLPNKIKSVEAGYDSLKSTARETFEEFRNGGGNLKNTADKFKNIGNNLSNIGTKFSNAGAALSKATAGVVLGMRYAGNAAMQFESDFAGVIKTVDATPQELERIRKAFLNLSTDIPVTANELTHIGEVAGQLGIKKENIVDFTKVMADMSVTTNLSSEQAATSLSQFMAIMGTSQDKVSNLGSAIVNLGNNFATSESKIVDMSQRLAPMGQLVNMSEADVLGLAAAMSTVGIEAEAGGTAMTQVMNKMQNAVFNGGQSLESFSKVAGVSASEFSTAFRNRPVEALELVLRGLNKTKEEGGNVNAVLEELGVTGVRESLAVNALAGALTGDKGLTKALELSNKGFNENTALQKEASTRYETTASKVQIAKNEINKMAIEIGAELLPNMVKLLENAKPLIKALGDIALRFSKLPPEVQLAVIGMGPALTFFGKAASIFGTTSKGLGYFIQLLGKLSTAKAASDMTKLAGSAASAGKAIEGVGSSASKAGSMAPLLSNPYVLAGAAIVAAVAGIGYVIYNEFTKHSSNHEESVKVTNGKYQEWFNDVVAGAEKSGGSIDKLSGVVNRNKEEVIKATQEMNTAVRKTADNIWLGDGLFGLEFDSPLRKKLKESLMLSDDDINEIRSNVEGSTTMVANAFGSITDSYARHETISKEFATGQISAMADVTTTIVENFQKQEQAAMENLERQRNAGTLTTAEYEKMSVEIKGKFFNMTSAAQTAFGTIKDIMIKASQEGRSLSASEMERLKVAYESMSKSMAKSATQNKEAQEALTQAFQEYYVSAQLEVLKNAGAIDEMRAREIAQSGTYVDKLKAVNDALRKVAANDTTVRLDVEYNGENIVFKWKTDMDIAQNMPDIIKTLKISEESGRSIEMTQQQLEALNKLEIHPKNVVIVDDNASKTVDNAKNKVVEYNNIHMPTKHLMAEDSASGVVKTAQFNLDKFNGTPPNFKSLQASDGVSNPAIEAKRNLDNFIRTNPDVKNLKALDGVSGVAQSVISWLDSIPNRKEVYIQAVMDGAVANGGHRIMFATGGHIDMFATGGNIGNTQWLDRGYEGIVGEAGPELFRVTKRGVNITPLSTREKIQGISGALNKGGSSNVNVTFNLSGITVREEADIEKITSAIEKKLIRSIKENKNGIGGGGGVYTL